MGSSTPLIRRLWVSTWLLVLIHLAAAATVTYDFNISWVTSNPDGLLERPTIGINGQWPIPRIDVNVGDRVIINVLNSLEEITSLHFHGMYMYNQSHMDGPVQVTQCGIPPGSRFTYNFTVDQPGTYWYHSHMKAQYPDGLRGPFVVHDPNNPFRGMYDEELVLPFSDWYHDRVAVLMPRFLTRFNPTGAEPVPKAALWNETQDLQVPVAPGKTYMFRFVNMAAFASVYVWFEGHNVTVIEVDGIYTQPYETGMIYATAAQRYSFLVTTRNDTSANFPFVASMDTDLFDTVPDTLNWNVTGWLVYDANNENPPAAMLDAFTPLDDTLLTPYDNMTILGEPDQIVGIEMKMDNLGDGANYAFVNNVTYVHPKVPTLYTALSAGALATDPTVYGTYTNPQVVPTKNTVVQLVIDNLDSGRHPWHLHGHAFQVVYRSDPDAGAYADANLNASDLAAMPMRRDVAFVNPGGFLVLRFYADNPGIWLFHCHIEWHVASGLVSTIVEAPLDLQNYLTIPQDHLDACAADGVPTVGNAAGNAVNLLDLSGQPEPPPPLPEGFTPKGIAAFVISCVWGTIGTAFVAWYGMVGGVDASAAAMARVGSTAGVGVGYGPARDGQSVLVVGMNGHDAVAGGHHRGGGSRHPGVNGGLGRT